MILLACLERQPEPLKVGTAGIHASHPSLGKSEGWGTQLFLGD